MKAARLNGDLLVRKGKAAPVPGVINSHPKPAHPKLAAVDPGKAKSKRRRSGAISDGRAGREMIRDRFGRVRLSLRMDSHRHLQLRLLAAHSQMSIQDTLIAALDAYLDGERQSIRNGNCDCLQEADRPPRKRKG